MPTSIPTTLPDLGDSAAFQAVITAALILAAAVVAWLNTLKLPPRS